MHRPLEPTLPPTPAERARTLLAHASSAVLDVPGLDLTARPAPWPPLTRVVLPDGTLVILLPDSSPVLRCVQLAHRQADNLRAVVEATDVAPVAVRHRIRGRAWAAGWLTPAPAADRSRYLSLLAAHLPAGVEAPGTPVLLEVADAVTDDLWGSAYVEADAFAAARPDPIAPHEAELLQHLAADHPAQLELLTDLIAERLGDLPTGPSATTPGVTAVPVALDRFGLRVRFLAGERVADARFDFARPVDGPEQLRTAMHLLFHRAAHRSH
ncbi:DUF2470 domain-containing protein [Kitasatospora sp. McL0602]|uniref:DUF2470 domain-containing protein n=1 Tax=Kitasatospora sp. McL0602 TaxID=3439530 RepID=UPI003F8BD03C